MGSVFEPFVLETNFFDRTVKLLLRKREGMRDLKKTDHERRPKYPLLRNVLCSLIFKVMNVKYVVDTSPSQSKDTSSTDSSSEEEKLAGQKKEVKSLILEQILKESLRLIKVRN